MVTLTVWMFDTPTGAEHAVDTLKRLDEQDLIQLHDAATVSWPPNKKKPNTQQLHTLAKKKALRGAFWGLVFGVIFFVPLLGVAAGAAMGGGAGALTDLGIDQGFVNSVRERVTPGTSALFAFTSEAVLDKVKEAFEPTGAELIQTNLSDEDEATLREVFGEDDD
jgi:uncharacterized membrane protein